MSQLGGIIMTMRCLLKSYIQKLAGLQEIVFERDKFQQELALFKKEQRFAPGHYYSPIPSMEEIRRDEQRIFGANDKNVPGVDFYESEQLRLIEQFLPHYKEMPFQAQKVEGLRYYFENPSYSYCDAIFLYCMIRSLRPKRIIEVGSGFSSCVTLDTNELFFDGTITTTFIDPYPELLMSLIKGTDKDKINIISSRLQDVDLDEFKKLESNDILFIDSTHISKINSDVNRIFFNILPVLASGVYIHFHDITFPFEYPKDLVYGGIAWNEAYMLRAFLQFNSSFRVVLMNTFMEFYHTNFFEEKMPLCLKNGGGHIWVRRV